MNEIDAASQELLEQFIDVIRSNLRGAKRAERLRVIDEEHRRRTFATVAVIQRESEETGVRAIGFSSPRD